MPDRILALDVGNSRIKCALFAGTEIELAFEMGSDPTASVAAYRHTLRQRIGQRIPAAAGMSSVVPALTDLLVDAVRSDFMVLPELVSTSLTLPIEIDYSPPESLGADRLAAACAAESRYGRDGQAQPRGGRRLDELPASPVSTHVAPPIPGGAYIIPGDKCRSNSRSSRRAGTVQGGPF